jgi:serine/threonine protein phosphatase 1
MRTLVISDIHGCYEQFVELLQLIRYTPREDQLIILGDLVDRGPNSLKVVEYVMTLAQEDHVIVLRGNHDQRFVEVMGNEQSAEDGKFFKHGGLELLDSYCVETEGQPNESRLAHAKKFISANYEQHLTFLANVPLYHEDYNHIYVHAGLNPNFINWREQPERDFMYIKDPFIYQPTVVNKPVVFGHTNTKDIHGSADIWFGGDKIGIDGGCAYGMQLNALEIKDTGEYQTYKVLMS